MVPVRPADWDLQGMFWDGMYYVDTCLPFGLRSAPCLFNHFADALHWVLATNYQIDAVHYLDDFLLVGAAGQQQCTSSIQVTLSVCERLGIPVAFEKLEGPSTQIIFLGLSWIRRPANCHFPRTSCVTSCRWSSPGWGGTSQRSVSCYPSLASYPLRPKLFRLGVYSCGI